MTGSGFTAPRSLFLFEFLESLMDKLQLLRHHLGLIPQKFQLLLWRHLRNWHPCCFSWRWSNAFVEGVSPSPWVGSLPCPHCLPVDMRLWCWPLANRCPGPHVGGIRSHPARTVAKPHPARQAGQPIDPSMPSTSMGPVDHNNNSLPICGRLPIPPLTLRWAAANPESRALSLPLTVATERPAIALPRLSAHLFWFRSALAAPLSYQLDF